MALERKSGGATSTDNNSYPTTAYGGDLDDYSVASKGVVVSEGANGDITVDWLVDFSDSAKTPASDEDDNQVHTIPAYAVIKLVDQTVLATISGGTSYDIGLEQPDGTVIDADGLDSAVTTSTLGSYVSGDGALVGASVGANDAQVVVGGDRTAGKLRIRVTYTPYND